MNNNTLVFKISDQNDFSKLNASKTKTENSLIDTETPPLKV
jgi:hypothetical protein